MTSFVDELLDAFGYPGSDREAFARSGLGALGESKQARAQRRRLALRKAVFRQAIRELDDAFDAEVPFIILKGEPLETLLFEGRYPRVTGDIDILVLPGDLDVVRRCLFELGYRKERDEQPRRWALNEESWIHDSYGAALDLHWSVALPSIPALPLHALFDTSVPFRFDEGLQVDVLRPDWLFLHLALHFHNHCGFAKGLLDLAGWYDRFASGVDTESVVERSRELGLFGLIQWPVHTMAHLIDIRPPMYRTEIDPLIELWARASARAMRNCLHGLPGDDLYASLVTLNPQVGPWRAVPLQALTMLTLDGWPTKARGVLQRSLLGPHSIGRRLDGFRRKFRR